MLNEKEKEFIIGLEKLTRKTGIAIGGCGCCDSPFLYEVKITSNESGYRNDNENIMWVDPSNISHWEIYSKDIKKDKS